MFVLENKVDCHMFVFQNKVECHMLVFQNKVDYHMCVSMFISKLIVYTNMFIYTK